MLLGNGWGIRSHHFWSYAKGKFNTICKLGRINFFFYQAWRHRTASLRTTRFRSSSALNNAFRTWPPKPAVNGNFSVYRMKGMNNKQKPKRRKIANSVVANLSPQGEDSSIRKAHNSSQALKCSLSHHLMITMITGHIDCSEGKTVAFFISRAIKKLKWNRIPKVSILSMQKWELCMQKPNLDPIIVWTEHVKRILPVNVHIEPKPGVVSLSLTHVLLLLVFLNPSQMGREGRLVLVLALIV